MIIFPLPSQLDSLFRQASTYFHLTQRIHQSRDVPFYQISTHFDMSYPPTHLHNHDDGAKLVVFHHLHYHHHHQRNLSVFYSPKHNSNTSHPIIHPSISLLQTSHIPNFISTSSNDDNHNNIYSTTTTSFFNQSINQSIPSTNQIEPSSSSNNNNNNKKEMKKNNQNKGKEQFSPITKNHSLLCCNPHPHPCTRLDPIVFYYGECGECGEYGEYGECGE